MSQKFTHLHVHSHYSLLDGLPKIDELLDYVKELGMDSVAITDHGNLYGAVEFYYKALQKGIKPIIGCEVYMAFEKMHNKRANIDDKTYHLVLLVKNEQGYKNLVKLTTKAHLEGFYYKPRIDEEILAKHTDGLICLSGCLRGKIPQLILNKKNNEAKTLILKYQKIFGKNNFYLEIQHHPNLPEQEIINKTLISFSKKLDIPIIATNDVHYLKSEDAEAQDILMLINTNTNPNDPQRLTMKAENFSLYSPKKMINFFKDCPEAIENSQKIVKDCNFQFEFNKFRLPYFKVPEQKTADQYLKELCFKGLKKRFKDPIRKQIISRLEYELSIIQKSKFSSYFLIVQDFVNWAKTNKIVVGPGRGSVCGSLVAYLLNITDINPLKYNLLFERFLSAGRTISPPDIDLDFTDIRRDEVINYITQKYGQDKVAQIITFGTMAAKAVIRDVGRALGYPYAYCDKIAKMIPFGFNLKQTLEQIDEFKQIYEHDKQATKLINLAQKLEGVARHVSIHACGVVISNEPLENIVPVQHPSQNNQIIITQYEMNSIEKIGLLKIDLLGLTELTIIENTLNLIKNIHKIEIDINNIPLNDKKTYQLLQQGNTTSIFQLESDGMKKYLKQLKPTQFEDIIVMLALYRPGPMQLLPEYIKRKHKKKKIEYLHPKLKPILEKTYGICVYQEQLLQITQKLAGLTIEEADILRKAVGKKIKKLLTEQKSKFIQGCVKNNISLKIAQKIWKWIVPFAGYGFNKSHATSYATIAYQTAYLKAHYPCEFMTSVLASEEKDIEKIAFLIDECQKMGIIVLAPDINESNKNFTNTAKNQIRFGLLGIKNVGHNVVEAIIKEREKNGLFQSMEDFISRIDSKDLNKRSLESLIKAGVFDKFGQREEFLSNLENLLQWNRDIRKNKNNHQQSLFGKIKLNNNLQFSKTKPISKTEKLNWEKELLGLFVTGHPLKDFEKIFKKKVLSIANINEKNIGKIVKIGGLISKVKKIITKNNKPMFFLNLEDLSGKIEIVVFPNLIERNPNIFEENKIVFISGKVDNRDNVLKIICNEIEEIIEN